MNKLVFLALLAPAATWAQTPANHPMPDGSRDMYLGLGAQSAPRYDGADSRKVSALPVLQVEFSNGIFVSGMQAGMHWSDRPTLEYGPLITVLPKRDAAGNGTIVAGVGVTANAPSNAITAHNLATTPLAGVGDIGARLTSGGFLNVYLDPAWRFSGSLLFGSGRERDGARLQLDVQRLALDIGARHQLTFSAGLTAVNRNDNQSYFGVSRDDAARSRFPYYAAGGGVRDAHAGLRWTWTWTPSWMLISSVQGKRLLGSASHSPLAERPSNLTVSTAIAYRF